MRNAIDLILAAAILIGGALALRAGRERAGLSEHHARLVAAAGELPVEDPNLIYIKAIDTGDPLHFAWRVHLPANINLKIQTRTGGGSSSNASWRSSADDFIARVRLREDEPDQVHVYTKFAGGGGYSGFGSPALARLLREHGRDLKVEQLGRSGAPTLDPNAPNPTILLRLGLPETLRSPDLPGWIDPAMFVEVSIGAPGSFP